MHPSPIAFVGSAGQAPSSFAGSFPVSHGATDSLVGSNGLSGIVDTNAAANEVLETAINGTAVGITAFASESDYTDNDPFPAETHESGLDRATMIAQDSIADTDRAIKFAKTDADSLDPTLPSSVERANKFMAFDGDGGPIASSGPTGDSSIPVSSFVETLLDDNDAATARATLGAQVDLDVPTQAEAEAGTATDERVWTAERVRQAFNAFRSLPRSYLSGLGLSNNSTDPAHDIDIAAGEARDSANAVDLVLSSVLTKRLDATWVAGTGQGGLSSSLTAPANNTWYHVHVIAVGGVVDVGFDTSISAANLVTDHSATAYRRLLSVLTDGSANIIAFRQDGDVVQWDVPRLDVSALNPGTVAVLRTLSTPLDVKTMAKLVIEIDNEPGTASGQSILTDPDVVDTAPIIGNAFGVTNLNTADVAIQVEVMTDTSSRIRTHASASSPNSGIKITTFGWTDRRGRDS